MSRFQTERRQAAQEEASGVSEESLVDNYKELALQRGRRPSEDELLGQFRTARASNKARQVMSGDFEGIKRAADEDMAWETYWAEQHQQPVSPPDGANYSITTEQRIESSYRRENARRMVKR